MKKLLVTLMVFGLGIGSAWAEQSPTMTIASTVIVKEVEDGLEAQDVIDAMLSKATEINMKYVGNLPLHKELIARGIESEHLEVFQFCNPPDARIMIDLDMTFSAYLPCRISLVGKDQKLYLTMMDLNLLINMAGLEGKLLKVAEKVRDSLQAIMNAGASGDF